MAPHVVYLLVLVVAVCLQGGLALHGLRYRHIAGGRAFTTVTLGGAVWTLLIGAMAVAEPAQARVLLSLKYLALGITTIATFLLVLALTGRIDRLARRTVLALFVIPVLGALCSWRDGWGMIRSLEWGQSVDLTWVAAIAFGPVYWLFTAYLYAALLTACALLVFSIARGAELARMQGFLLLAGIVTVMACNVLLITGIADRRFDPMPVGLALSAFLLWWSTFRHGLLELVPVARSALVDALADGVIVVDGQGRIIDLNATMHALLGDEAPRLIGEPLGSAHASLSTVDAEASHAIHAALARVDAPPTPPHAHAAPRVSLRGRAFDVRAFRVGPAARRSPARVIVLHDVTAVAALLTEQSRLIGELQSALGQVRTLTGLLPICASCKQIRDGEGAWHPLESYIRARTHAEFTHGICPACVELHYAEYLTES
jgi:PAS domain-containing protein